MKQPQTIKLAFIVSNDHIYEKVYSFDFFSGFSISQKQKTIAAFHKAISQDGIRDVLEISRMSSNPIGNALSAFNLTLTLQNKSYPLECVYQSSKVFNQSIQYHEVLNLSPVEAKKTIQQKVDAEKLILTSFNCFGINFPLTPTTLFYDYIYVLALSQNNEIASQTIRYNCFTDIEFNHKKQFASQARACAIYKYLTDHQILIETINDFNKFKSLYSDVIVPYQATLELL